MPNVATSLNWTPMNKWYVFGVALRTDARKAACVLEAHGCLWFVVCGFSNRGSKSHC